jgi:biotin carboxylase
MNVLFLSPHFPRQYHLFCAALKRLGVTVLGIGDTPWQNLNNSVRASLTDYYHVGDMDEYEQLYRAVALIIARHGRVSYVESLNEHWLAAEARLRTDFNIEGIRCDRIDDIKLKSRMKEKYRKGGVHVVNGSRVADLKEALSFAKETGYPLVAKPDNGVGAANTYKVSNPDELRMVFHEHPQIDYFLEVFVDGDIYSFDGLTNQEGTPVFYTAHTNSSGIMEIVLEDLHVYYYSLRDIPADLIEAGLKTLKAFDVRRKFFHLEFFRTRKEGTLVALEVNIRPPGGFTTDMFNYANDIDIYQEWANMLVFNEFSSDYSRKYHCCYIGRKSHKGYAHSHAAMNQRWGDLLLAQGEMPPIFARAMGDYYYLTRAQELETIKAMTDYALELA